MRVNDFVGIPYCERNCGQLAIFVLSNFAINLDDPGAAATRAILAGKDLVSFVPSEWLPVENDSYLPLDLLFTSREDLGYHVSIVGEDGWCLTTSEATGSILVGMAMIAPHVRSSRRPQA